MAMEDELMMMDWDIMDQLISTKPDKDGYDFNPDWSQEEKIEPWWRVADKDELALLVAKKSVENIENCDLPSPLKIAHNYGNNDDDYYDGKLSSSFEKNLRNQIDRSIYNSETTYNSSSSSSSTNNMTFKPSRPKTLVASSDTNSSDNSQLLEALCRSQTRAREAELAASKAYVEKEHAIKLLFKQASHLFAYKQWVQLLQLESICLQHKIKDEEEQFLSTTLLLTTSNKDDDNEEDARRKEEKKKKNKCCFCSYIVAFAAGISLAGASVGLILGWTLGWLLPMV